MKNGFAEIVIVLVIVTIIGLLIWNYGPKTDEEAKAYLKSVSEAVAYTNSMNSKLLNSSLPIQCEHEFIITSKYNWILRSYKTISKCIKCGQET